MNHCNDLGCNTEMILRLLDEAASANHHVCIPPCGTELAELLDPADGVDQLGVRCGLAGGDGLVVDVPDGG